MMTPKELTAYAKVMRKHGIESFTAGDVYITLAKDHQPPKKADKAVNGDPFPEVDAYTDEEILNWSTGSVGAE